MRHPLKLLSALMLVLATSQPLRAAPVAVTDDTGREIRLAAPARRIVSLAPHATENLYAAGAGTALVGAVDYSDYPPAAKQLPRVGGYTRIDLEAILRLKPDLVIAWESGNAPAQVEKLRALGIPVFVTQPNTMDDVAVQLEQFGRLAGTEKTAQAAASAFRQRLAQLRADYGQRPKVRVFYQIWKEPLMTVGKPQIITSAIGICGGENIYGDLNQMAPTVSLEAVLTANPEAIVATGMGDAKPEWLDDWKRWPRLLAMQRGNLFHINPDIMQRHTPRILDGTEALCRALETARQRRP
ncbi:cobalamin-binding protein [Azovibrio restrictus]|uniref:cobalamin-binding protein n=1 Tax=Azovibrio restrictus TaxID=146938 RepID=UPI0026EFEC38|nr:cobalamin-binding protein [Azovibrio restrictus]